MSSGLAQAAGRAVGLVGEAGATGVQAPWGQTPACPWALGETLSQASSVFHFPRLGDVPCLQS